MSLCNHMLPDGAHASAGDGERLRVLLGTIVCDGLEDGSTPLPDVASFVASLDCAGSLVAHTVLTRGQGRSFFIDEPADTAQAHAGGLT